MKRRSTGAPSRRCRYYTQSLIALDAFGSTLTPTHTAPSTSHRYKQRSEVASIVGGLCVGSCSVKMSSDGDLIQSSVV